VKQDQDSHRFLQMLHHLGWTLGTVEDPQPFVYGRSRLPRGRWQAAPLPDGTFLLLVFLDDVLPDLNQAFKAYEDLAPLHAEIRPAVREQNLLSRHVLLLDDQANAQLLDFEQEDVLIDARGEEDITDRLLPLLNLNKLAAGSLTSFPRKSLRQRARELADWTRLWSTRIGAAADTTPAMISQFFFWLHLSRLAEKLELAPSRKVSFSNSSAMGKPPQSVRYLIQFLRPLNETWNLLQGHSIEVQKKIAEHANARAQLEPCLDSYSRLSASKFSSHVFAEAFADEELRMTGWRNSLVHSEIPSEEDPSRWLIDHVDVDLDDEGFSGLLARFDSVTEDLRRLAREQAVLRERGERPGLQMDFFGEEPPALREEDAPRIALQSAVRVRTSSRQRAEVARLVLLAHTAEWQKRLRRTDPIFPQPQIEASERIPPRRPRVSANPELN
jgi:hypothetical protein